MARGESAIFTRGSRVLDYWLVHAEGLTVRAGRVGRGRVEAVVFDRERRRPRVLIVRSALSRRRRLPANAFVAVDPFDGVLYLEREPDASALSSPRIQPRPGTALDAARRFAAELLRAARLGSAWLSPRLRSGGLVARAGAARVVRAAVAAAAAAAVWLAPRLRRRAGSCGRATAALFKGASPAARRLARLTRIRARAGVVSARQRLGGIGGDSGRG